ncbi:hypothetical protein D7Y13_06010 [Corallococcus praedator]|uniref:Sel1 repeat family protein n=1 Tax=Corallococcus praedator TaxID=2316724 RepID=A0ABX9QQ74_9BACT|nr:MULTISPECIES: hypothetical protein [Corallococcus]RKH33412.1 hypothetical protein D7X75_12310 [Corallococcus sp. CA031C]RKI14536.1 hypothetical protein D7Y13_06010 [Corallococcus praedator]
MLRVVSLALLLLGGAACQRALTPEEDRARALDIVRARASVAEREGCPAEVVPERQAKSGDFSTYCDKRLSWCAHQCFESDVTACYGLAIVLQEDKRTAEWAEPLFYRSCALGLMSGCTNRAAGLQVLPQPDDTVLACTARTYEKTCSRGDPWGCSMHGLDLVQGKSLARDLKKARNVLGRSCKFGPEDPACQAARKLLSQLDAYEKQQGQQPDPK